MSGRGQGTATAPQLSAALLDVRAALEATALPLEVPGAAAARAARSQTLGQLDDYVLPRLDQIEAPLLAVVGGSTGAGKSTLVNSVVGRRVTEPGVLRPTTRSPVLVLNPADAGWFADTRILPDLARSSFATGDPRTLQLVAVDSVPAGLAVLDAPDIDSVEVANRTLAGQLLAAADLWLFVTSAARYADQVPWDFLRSAAERSTAVAIVLDRVPPGAREEVSAHLGEMMAARGLGASRLFVVDERPVDGDGLLPADEVAPVRTWLSDLAADSGARAAVVRQTLDGAVALGGPARARGGRRQRGPGGDAGAAHLRRGRAYEQARAEVSQASADGSLLRGEVLARWQEFVGTGELLRNLESRVGWVRDRVGGWLRGKPQQVERVTVAVESGLESLLVEHAEAAAEQTWQAWSSLEAGQRLLADSDRDLARASRDLRGRAERAIRDWQQGVLEMVRSEGADKRSTARFLAFGVNGLSVALMVVVFAHTAGVSGIEVGIAGGSAVVGQKVLEAVFGDEAVRRLAEFARADLDRRVVELYEAEQARYLTVLEALGHDPAGTERLRSASAALSAPAAGRRRGRGRLVSGVVDSARRLVGRRGPGITERLDALDAAAAGSRGRLDGAVVDRAEAVVRRGRGRLELSGDHTVVALAGATGSGKSSTFNALSGLDVATVSVRRPTTSVTTGVVWGGRTPRTCWTGSTCASVTRWTPARPRALEGLVLLDLPDHDSTEVAHHVEVDRLVGLVDLLVWVLDPQKYADAALHERYLRPMAGHRDVTVVVLNHIDEVAAADRAPDAGGPATAARRRRPGRGAAAGDVGHRGHRGGRAAGPGRPPGQGQAAVVARLTADVAGAVDELPARHRQRGPRRGGPGHPRRAGGRR